MEFLLRDIYDVNWMSQKMGCEVKSVKPRDQSKLGGLSGEMIYLDVEFIDGGKIPILLKRSPTADGSSSSNSNAIRISQGTAREAMFYKELAPKLSSLVSKAYWTHCDMATGEMAILMECFQDCIPCGVMFGMGNPNNWGISRDTIDSMCSGNPNAIDITMKSFRLYAQMHASYWRTSELRDMEWLNNQDRFRGEGKEKWLNAFSMAIDGFADVKQDIANGMATFEWDQHLVACMDVSFTKIDWDVFQTELHSRPFSLVHGDCHPHNALWCQQRTPEAHVKLIDFEMVGLGSPAQDIGQYMISHMTAETRRECESDVVRGYYDALIRALVSDEEYSYKIFLQEYIDGGFGRWCWFMGAGKRIFGGDTPLGIKMQIFFHDQLAAFAKDHIPNPQDAPMPRV